MPLGQSLISVAEWHKTLTVATPSPSSSSRVPALSKTFGVSQRVALICGAALMGLLFLVPRVSREGLVSAGGEALLGPVLAVTLALATRRMLPSLLVGVLASAIALSTERGVIPTAEYLGDSVLSSFKIYIALFTMCLLGMAAIMAASGGTAGLVHRARRWVNSGRSAKLATSFLGLVMFFDDYANCMVVGPTMRPLTDEHRISRAKLAYIVDSTAAPVAGLALLSTWVGYEIGLASDAADKVGMSLEGINLLIAALPFRFYCVFALAMVFITSALNRDFGPMLRAERDCAAGKAPHSEREPNSGPQSYDGDRGAPPRARNALAPVVALALLTGLGLLLDGLIGLSSGALAPWYTGEFWLQISAAAQSAGSVASTAFWRAVLGASENNTLVLFGAALISVGIAAALPLAQRALTVRQVVGSFFKGVRHSLLPLGILVLAWALGATCDALGTGPVMAGLLADRLDPMFIPLVTFFCGAVIAFATGSSWTAMGILIPTAVPVAFAMGGEAITVIAIAAVLDGAIFGDHCSPISDTTIMSSIGADAGLLDHVVTQAPYAALAMMVAALFGYLPAGAGFSPWLSLLVGALVLVAITLTIGRRVGQPTPKAKPLRPTEDCG